MASSYSLPEHVVLKSKYNGKYLEYVKEEGSVHGYLRFTGEDVTSPLAKFSVESAEIDPELVHLRSCYINKYLAVSSQTSHWIISEAAKPEEDKSKWSCTLFRPIPLAGDGKDYRFMHVYTGNYAVLMGMGAEHAFNNCISAEWPSPNSYLCDVCTVVDWKSLVVFPQHVAFKGDNGNYLGLNFVSVAPMIFQPIPFVSFDNVGINYLRFGTSDSGDAKVAHEVFPNSDGSIRIKSTHSGKFWRRSPNWIWADSDDTSCNDKDTVFWPVKVDENTVALRNLGNDRFCKRLTTEGKSDCLNASASSVSNEAKLQVTDHLLSRDVYNVHFHMDRARRYNEQATVVGNGIAPNPTNNENSMEVKVAHTETNSNSWNNSVSFTLGAKTTLVTKVPLIAEGHIEISAELSTGHQWGKVHEETHTFEVVHKVSVPPMTKATVSAVGRTATCDIPFSYTQAVTLLDGTQRTYNMSDGVYTGVKCFDVTYNVKHTKI